MTKGSQSNTSGGTRAMGENDEVLQKYIGSNLKSTVRVNLARAGEGLVQNMALFILTITA